MHCLGGIDATFCYMQMQCGLSVCVSVCLCVGHIGLGRVPVWSKCNVPTMSRSKSEPVTNIQPSSIVQNLGVYLDSELTMNKHVVKIAAACFYHIRRLRQIRRRVGPEVTSSQPILELVTSWLEYCNSVLAPLS